MNRIFPTWLEAFLMVALMFPLSTTASEQRPARQPQILGRHDGRLDVVPVGTSYPERGCGAGYSTQPSTSRTIDQRGRSSRAPLPRIQ